MGRPFTASISNFARKTPSITIPWRTKLQRSILHPFTVQSQMGASQSIRSYRATTNFHVLKEAMMKVTTGGDSTAFDQVQDFVLKLNKKDRCQPNYSPAIEERLVEPTQRTQRWDVEECFLPSLSEFRLIWSISPALAMKDILSRLRLFGQRTHLAKQEVDYSKKDVSPEESTELIERGKKYLEYGNLFLLSAWGLGELANSLRLLGKEEESHRIARLSYLRNVEALLLGVASERTFLNQPLLSEVCLAHRTSMTEALLRHREWRQVDEYITGTLEIKFKPRDPSVDDGSGAAVSTNFLRYITLMLQAESRQLCKRYAEAIPIWHQLIEQSKPFRTQSIGVRDLTVIDFTTQLSHCYLQVNEPKRAWKSYELGLKLERVSRRSLGLYRLGWKERQTKRFDSARADAEIMKQHFLNNIKDTTRVNQSDQTNPTLNHLPLTNQHPTMPSTSSSSQSEINEYLNELCMVLNPKFSGSFRVNFVHSAFWWLQAGTYLALFYFVSQNFMEVHGLSITSDEVQQFGLKLLSEDRTYSNYSPAIEDRLEPTEGFPIEEYFVIPSLYDFRVNWLISPRLAVMDLLARLRILGDGQRLAKQEISWTKEDTSPNESAKLIEQGKKFFFTGHTFLLGAKALNELTISLRLQGKEEEANRISRLSSKRSKESALLLLAAISTLNHQWHTLSPDVCLTVHLSIIEAAIRCGDWKLVDDGMIDAQSLQSNPTADATDISDAIFFNNLIKYQTLVLKAESLQIRKQYQAAISVWEEAIQVAIQESHPILRLKYQIGQFGVRNLSTVDAANQLSHCYLQLNDYKRAWGAYQLGSKLERVEVELIEKMSQEDLSNSWLQGLIVTQDETVTSARADAEIMKQKILLENNGQIPVDGMLPN